MYALTSIGIIDTKIPLNCEFALEAIGYTLYEEVLLNYEMHFKEKNEGLSLLVHGKVNALVNEIMLLKQYQQMHQEHTTQHRQSCIG